MSYEFIGVENLLSTNDTRRKAMRPVKRTAAASKAAAEEFRNARLIIAEGCEYSMDDYSTKLSNNVLITGSVGCGKTRNIVSPNIHEATGSYIITDPKGNLYKKYGDYLRKKGYNVLLLDFIDPTRSVKYNPLAFIRSTQDILKIASVIVNSDDSKNTRADPFWDNNSTTFLCSILGYLYERNQMNGTSKCSIAEVMNLLREGSRQNEDSKISMLSNRFRIHKNANPKSWACEQFDNINAAPYKTYDCIRTTLTGKFASLDTPELNEMLSGNGFSFRDVADRKTAVFVNVSDTDRSLDILVDLFFTQAMNELCYYADNECEDNRLPIPVRFILDDFATNCKIKEFPRMISSFRSRAISVMLMIQAESQLKACYGDDASTIIANCDTYAYLGGNDLATQKSISERCDRPFREVASMPVGSCWVFRRGSKPVFTSLKDPSRCIEEMISVREQERD